jgi:acetyl-CoA synthetase
MSVSRKQDRQSQAAPQANPRAVTDPYQVIHQGFGWKVPKHFNMAQACCTQWAVAACDGQTPSGA